MRIAAPAHARARLGLLAAQPHELTQPIVVHGPSGTGKSGVLADLLAASGCPHILVDVALCPTVRAANCDALEQLSALLRSGGVNGASAPAGASASASADADADTPIAPVAASTAAIAKRPAVRGDGLATFCASLRAHFGGNSLGGVGEGAARRPRTLYVVYERAERLADGSAAAAAFNTWGAERGGAHACGGFASALLSLRQLAGNANVCAIFVCRAPWARYAQIAAAAAPVLVRFPQYTPAQLESILLQHPPPPPTLPTPPAAAPTTTTTAAAADVLAVRKAHWRPFVHVFVSIASEQALHLPTLLARAPPLFNSFVAPLLTEAAAGGAGAGASTAALLARARPLLRQLGKALYAGDPTEGAALHDLHAAEPALGMSRAAADAARAGGGSAGGSAAAGSKRARGAAGDESGDESEEAEEAAMTTPPRASAQPAAPPQFNSGPDRGLELPLQARARRRPPRPRARGTCAWGAGDGVAWALRLRAILWCDRLRARWSLLGCVCTSSARLVRPGP